MGNRARQAKKRQRDPTPFGEEPQNKKSVARPKKRQQKTLSESMPIKKNIQSSKGKENKKVEEEEWDTLSSEVEDLKDLNDDEIQDEFPDEEEEFEEQVEQDLEQLEELEGFGVFNDEDFQSMASRSFHVFIVRMKKKRKLCKCLKMSHPMRKN